MLSKFDFHKTIAKYQEANLTFLEVCTPAMLLYIPMGTFRSESCLQNLLKRLHLSTMQNISSKISL